MYLQLRQLLEVHTERAMHHRLGKLPNSLRGAYDEIYKEISASDVYEKSVVDRVFKWLMCAHKPMGRLQLLQAVSINYTRPKDWTEVIGTDDVLGLCRNMVVFDGTHWKFAHLSVREYLEETHCSLRHADLYAAKLCLGFALEVWKKPRATLKEDDKASGPAFPRKPPPPPPPRPFQSHQSKSSVSNVPKPDPLSRIPRPRRPPPPPLALPAIRSYPKRTVKPTGRRHYSSTTETYNPFLRRPLPAERRSWSDGFTAPTRGNHVPGETGLEDEE